MREKANARAKHARPAKPASFAAPRRVPEAEMPISRTFGGFPGRQRLVLPKFVNVITQELDVVLDGILVEIHVSAAAVGLLAAVCYAR